MNESNLFFGFRGSIVFPDQSSIFNMNLSNDSASKNQIFRGFFEMVKENKKVESHYQSRTYFLIYRNIYENILHCQLARKRQFSKRELVNNNIIDTEDDDYPYVNILVNLKSQKFLIESNTQVFENYNTCKNVIENIINNNLKEKDIKIVLESIVEEENFWQYFKGKDSKIYNIELKLIAPNIFGAEDNVNDFLNDAQKNVGCEMIDLRFSNSKGNLHPNKKGIDSYIKFICAGGGSWKITRQGKNGKKEKISSKQRSTKVNIPISYENFKKALLTEMEINKIIECFNSIETFENLKENL